MQQRKGIKAVILAGGKGSRLSEETAVREKLPLSAARTKTANSCSRSLI